MPGSKDFGYLLAQSRQLTAHIDEETIPALQKGPAQLTDAAAVMAVRSRGTERRSQRAAAAADAAERNAAIRLLGRDFDAEQLTKKVTSMDLRNVATLEALGETDIEGYLRHNHDMIIVTAIEEVRSNAVAEADEGDWAHLREEWLLAKQQLQEELGLRSAAEQPLADAGAGGAADHAMAMLPALMPPGTPMPATPGMQMLMPPMTPLTGGSTATTGMAALTPMSVSALELSMSMAGTPAAAVPATPGAPGVAPTPGGAAPAGGATPASAMDPSMQQHAAIVRELNAARQRAGVAFPLATEFARSSQARLGAGARGGREFAYNQCWHLCRRMLREHETVLAERALEGCRGDPARLDLLVRGAQEYLEEQYANYVLGRVQQARVGGVPGPIPAVQAFARQQRLLPSEEQGPTVAGLPLWRQVYLCLRCGFPDKALELAELAAEQGQAGVDPQMVAALREHWTAVSSGGAGFAASDAAYMHAVLQTHEREEDPFKQAIANLLVRADAEFERQEVTPKIEDFMWQRIVFCRGGAHSRHGRPTGPYGVEQLADTILRFGDSHFDRDGRDPFAYFKLLLMCCEFERAVSYLWRRGLLVEATHFAIALHHAGALHVDGPSAQGGGEDDGQPGKQPQPRRRAEGGGGGGDAAPAAASGPEPVAPVDFTALIKQYLHRFARTEPREAVEYLLLLRDGAAQQEALTQLVLETRQFAALVGTIGEDGLRHDGALWRHLSREQVLAVVRGAARQASLMGQFADAVELFHLAGEHGMVIATLNAQLGQVLCPPNATRDYWKGKATAYAQSQLKAAVVRHVMETQPGLSETFQLLLNLMVFFDFCAAGKWQDALTLIETLDVLPRDDHPDAVNPKVLLFEQFDESVRRNFHEVVLKTMECLYRLYDQARRAASSASAGAAADRTRQDVLETLRRKASALVTFTGLLNFRIPEDTNLRLTRYEVSMM